MILVATLTSCIASCATVVRLGYLTLYNNPEEFMYSTGAIGLWSIVEEGIGIIAGSMPALRPLLNLPVFRSTYASNTGSNGISSRMNPPHISGNKHTRIVSENQKSSLELNDFRSGMTTRVGFGNGDKARQSIDDGDSQKYILKQTRVVMTTEQT